MTLHKLQNDRNGSAAPMGINVSLIQELHDLGDAIMHSRAIQGFDHAARVYPIHRQVRCAVRREVAPLFDDVALHLGCSAQRLDEGAVLLDAPGIFISGRAYDKGGYASCIFQVWADSIARCEEVRERLLKLVGDQRLRDRMFVVDWNFCSSQGNLVSTTFDELTDEVLLDEAYPSLGSGVDAFIARYLDARESVLILQGPPGTGKTRLVRAMLAAMSQRKGDSAKVMYTADKRALDNDQIFVDFVTGSHDAFVIEDADHLLRARTSGNRDMHRFLCVADGVVRTPNRKVIFTTNLPNISDIDDALLRPGRCFAVMTLLNLSPAEALRLAQRICGDDVVRAERARAALAAAAAKSYSVAQVYRSCG